MDKKTRPMYMLSTRDPLQIQGHIQSEIEGWEANGYQKKAGIAKLL